MIYLGVKLTYPPESDMCAKQFRLVLIECRAKCCLCTGAASSLVFGIIRPSAYFTFYWYQHNVCVMFISFVSFHSISISFNLLRNFLSW